MSAFGVARSSAQVRVGSASRWGLEWRVGVALGPSVHGPDGRGGALGVGRAVAGAEGTRSRAMTGFLAFATGRPS